LAATFSFKNFGKTPAFIDEVLAGVDVIANPRTEPTNPDYAAPYAFVDDTVIAPQQESGPVEVVLSRLQTEDEWHALTRGQLFFVLYGIIKYSDTFGDNGRGKCHHSKFCYYYSFGRRDGFYFLAGPSSNNEYT
jgi:hypothetical protein